MRGVLKERIPAFLDEYLWRSWHFASGAIGKKGAKEKVWLAYELSQLPYAFSKFGASYVDGTSPWTAQYGPAKDDELLVVMAALSDVASIDALPANVCRRRAEDTTDDATCLD
ncbi:hypothetical protein H257_12319 [Aphanomyces astaci]|uniref:Uncharacterized protein n=1 Tax=Aphanomyces astaci TaxID=112090 RepID=W4G0W7_APHAT|nr:hypothetical protein H257_12319 [Aphanomyces astaci]ETV72553.1 hypothetical protein H257_12319 [Aphanomyces astaci]|eukprot:XP_009837781.1 hypothetical protein H257_12319 [Aphanomyces astaci]